MIPRQKARLWKFVYAGPLFVAMSLILDEYVGEAGAGKGTNFDVRKVPLHAWWLVRKIFALCIYLYIYIYIHGFR